MDNRSDKLPYLAYSWPKMKKGRKAMIFWSPCRRYNSGTESNNAGTDSKASLDHKIPGDRETLFFYNMREIPPAPEKTATMPFCKSPFRVVSRCSATGCITQESRRKGRTAVTGHQQGNQLTLKNPTAYYLTIASWDEMKKAFSPASKP